MALAPVNWAGLAAFQGPEHGFVASAGEDAVTGALEAGEDGVVGAVAEHLPAVGRDELVVAELGGPSRQGEFGGRLIEEGSRVGDMGFFAEFEAMVGCLSWSV